jgi:hypothetical protein
MCALEMHVQVRETGVRIHVLACGLSMEVEVEVPEMNALGRHILMSILRMEIWDMHALRMHVKRINRLRVQSLAIDAARSLGGVRVLVGHGKGEQFSCYYDHIVNYMY